MNADDASERRPPLWLRFRRSRWSGLGLLAPALVALSLLFFLPMLRIAYQSFTEPVPGIGNYAVLFTDGYSVRVLVRTLVVSLTVAFVGGAIAYPYAYAMTIVKSGTRAVLFTIVLVPLWTSMMARNFAWVILLYRDGPVAKFLRMFGLEVELFGSPVGVGLAMIQVLLPFIVLPMYSGMHQIDRSLIAAAQGLGASRRKAFFRVYFPLSMPGIIAGVSLAFVLALGFYITPAMLGRPQQALIAQLIRIRVGELLDFGGAGALGMLLLFATLAVVGTSAWLVKQFRGPSGAVAPAERTRQEDEA